MDTVSLVQAIGATLLVLIGGGLLAWSLHQRLTGRAEVGQPAAAPLVSVADASADHPHPSWADTIPTRQPEPDTTLARRAAILSGLQLTLVAALLIGGLYLASTVTADQLIRLGR